MEGEIMIKNWGEWNQRLGFCFLRKKKKGLESYGGNVGVFVGIGELEIWFCFYFIYLNVSVGVFLGFGGLKIFYFIFYYYFFNVNLGVFFWL